MRGRKAALPAGLVLPAAARGGRERPAEVTRNGREAPITLPEDGHVRLTAAPASVTDTAAVTLHGQGISQIGYGNAYNAYYIV